MSESVKVIRRRQIPDLLKISHGIRWFNTVQQSRSICDSIHKMSFGAMRDETEDHEDVVQVASYTIVAGRKPERDNHYLLSYQRSQGGEDRLESKFSIGIGGHLRPEEDLYFGSLRELYEEVLMVSYKFNIIGLIHDPGDAVGRAHLGVISCAFCESMENLKAVRKEGIYRARFLPENEFMYHETFGTYERWSQLILTSIGTQRTIQILDLPSFTKGSLPQNEPDPETFDQ